MKYDKKIIPTFGIHTLEVRLYDLNEKYITKEFLNCISGNKLGHLQKTSNDENKYFYKVKLNLNDFRKGFCSASEFEDKFSTLINELHCTHSVHRVDMPFDYFENNYNDTHKIHKLICLLFMNKYKLKNAYESRNLYSLEHLTSKVQNQYMELENYNKEIESNGKSPVKNRIELRAKALSQSNHRYNGIEYIAKGWKEKLMNISSQYDAVLNGCNQQLLKKWKEENNIKVQTIDEFIRKYEDNIYCKKQLVDFLNILGFNGDCEYRNFLRRSKVRIDYISKVQLNDYMDILIKSINKFIKK